MPRGYMLRSKTTEYETPQWLFDLLDAEYSFTLDPCATPENAKCEMYYTRKDNGLIQSWKYHNVFMNPPFGEAIKAWVKKAYTNIHNIRGNTAANIIVGLLPAYTSSKWFHDYVLYSAEIRFIKGRLNYKTGTKKTKSAPFPSMVTIWGGIEKGLGPTIEVRRNENL